MALFMLEILYVIVLLLISAIAVSLASFWWSRRRLRELAALLPGPRPPRFNLIIGDAARFVQSSNDTFKVLCRMIDEFGPTCRLWIGPKLCVLFSEPEDAEAILSNTELQTRDQFMMKVMRPLAGDGLITSKGDIWRIHRKLMLPTFHSKVLEEFVEVFHKNAEILVQNLTEHVNGPSFDVGQIVGLCTMDMISETAMGENVDAQMKKENEFVMSLKREVEIIQSRVAKPWLLVDWFFSLTSLGREEATLVKSVNSTVDGVILKQLRQYRMKDSEPLVNGHKTRNINSLGLLIEMSGSESNIVNIDFMRDEINTLLVAGQESTATIISFALVLLGLHQDIQDKVIKEQLHVYDGNLCQVTTSQALHRMKYLERVVKETLRLFPPAPMITREIVQETNINGTVVPAGCTAIILNYKTHRHPKWFPNYNEFDPDRFLSERSQGRHAYSFIPFGIGQKSCIGQKYAMIQMKAVLSVILKQFKVSTICTSRDLEELEMGMVLRPTCGFPIKLQPRKLEKHVHFEDES